MLDKKLVQFLCKKTKYKEIGEERLLHDFPLFGEMVGEAINTRNLLSVSINLSDLLENMDLYKACLISNFIGFACEKEENTAAGKEIIKLFSKACNLVYEMMRENEVEGECEIPSDFSKIYKRNKDWVRAYYGFERICISAMSFLTRDVELRLLLREMGMEEKIRYLAEETPNTPYLHSIYYVGRMLDTCANLKLLVLDPEKQQGFFAVANDMDNCFHLIFLLEEQIAKKVGEKYGMDHFNVEETVVQLGHGVMVENLEEIEDDSYHTHFLEYNYGAILEQEDIPYLIWGEMPPEAIPSIDDYGIIVLKKAENYRRFDIRFLASYHTVLKPAVEIERELTKEEYEMWIGRIKKE